MIIVDEKGGWCVVYRRVILCQHSRGCFSNMYIDGSVQDCSISSALAMEMLKFCTEPSIYKFTHIWSPNSLWYWSNFMDVLAFVWENIYQFQSNFLFFCKPFMGQNYSKTRFISCYWWLNTDELGSLLTILSPVQWLAITRNNVDLS